MQFPGVNSDLRTGLLRQSPDGCKRHRFMGLAGASQIHGGQVLRICHGGQGVGAFVMGCLNLEPRTEPRAEPRQQAARLTEQTGGTFAEPRSGVSSSAGLRCWLRPLPSSPAAQAQRGQPVSLWQNLRPDLRSEVTPDELGELARRLLESGAAEAVRHDGPALALLAYLQSGEE